MIMNDQADKPCGHFKLSIFRKGELVETVDEPNLIVDVARNILAHLLGGDLTNRPVNRIGFGTGTSAPAAGNTALTAPYYKTLDSVSYPSTNSVQFNFTLAAGEANGMAISEFGLVNAGTQLFARKTRTAPLNKDSDLSLTGSWTITF